MKTIEEITEYCKFLSAKKNDEFNIPVLLNKRLTSTLGRVIIGTNDGWITCFPYKMEFSVRFLEAATEEEIKSIIKHEWCHYYLCKTTKEAHGHDRAFKDLCAEIGCKAYKAETKLEEATATALDSKVSKYSVFCSTCNKYIGHYNRMCPTLKNIGLCICNRCGKMNLSYVQNY